MQSTAQNSKVKNLNRTAEDKDGRMPALMSSEKLPDEPSLHIKIRFDGIPKCVSAEQYALWTEAARFMPPQTYGFCTDCTKEYQTEMLLQERCAHPEVKFRKQGRLTNEGFIPDLEGF